MPCGRRFYLVFDVVLICLSLWPLCLCVRTPFKILSLYLRLPSSAIYSLITNP